MTAMNFPASPVNGQQTTDGRYYFDSSVGSTGAWRSTPTPVGGLPAGSIIQWASSTIPTNWLLADGTAVSRTTYASLFAAIGTQYGTGDGSTTFNLPDLRGRIPVGRNGGSFGTLAATGGSETNTLTANNLPAHTHSVNDPGHSHHMGPRIGGGSSGWGTVVNAGYTGGADQPYWYSGGAGTGITVGNNTTTNSAVNNLQPYLVVNYIIKATAGWTAGDSELAVRLGAVEQKQILSPNYVINGAFDIWQRGTSFTGVTTTYCADRWLAGNSGATMNVTRETFPVGQTEVDGNPTYFLRLSVTTGNDFARLIQRIEDVRTLSGKTITVSFWAKGTNPGGGKLYLGYLQSSNGTSGVSNYTAADFTLTSNWQRFSRTITIPALSGTIVDGATYVELILGQGPDTSTSAWTLDLANVQVETGTFATPFRRNAPSIQAELAACQRYFYRVNSGEATGWVTSDTAVIWFFNQFPVTMRATPTTSVSSSSQTYYIPYWGESGSGTPNASDVSKTFGAIAMAPISPARSTGKPAMLGGTGQWFSFTAEL